MSFDPPKELTGRALEEWNKLVPHLKANGYDQPQYIEVFATLCQAIQTKYECLAELAEFGHVIESKKDGTFVRNQAAMTLNQSIGTILQISKLFGLSPADAKALANEAGKEDDEAPSYMKTLQRKWA